VPMSPRSPKFWSGALLLAALAAPVGVYAQPLEDGCTTNVPENHVVSRPGRIIHGYTPLVESLDAHGWPTHLLHAVTGIMGGNFEGHHLEVTRPQRTPGRILTLLDGAYHCHLVRWHSASLGQPNNPIGATVDQDAKTIAAFLDKAVGEAEAVDKRLPASNGVPSLGDDHVSIIEDVIPRIGNAQPFGASMALAPGWPADITWLDGYDLVLHRWTGGWVLSIGRRGYTKDSTTLGIAAWRSVAGHPSPTESGAVTYAWFEMKKDVQVGTYEIRTTQFFGLGARPPVSPSTLIETLVYDSMAGFHRMLLAEDLEEEICWP
jgi:hypothetical protein